MTTVEVDGFKFPAKYIGKGKYSKVYRVGNRVVYYTRGDCAKEVLAMFQYDRIAHLPEIVRHDDVFGYHGRRWYVFSSPYYRNVTKKDKSAWLLRKKIIDWYDVFYRQHMRVGMGQRYPTGVKLMADIVNDFKKSDVVPYSVVRALQKIVDIASNCGYGDMGFDFHRQNFGVNEYGTLIFRDPFYVYSGG